MKRIKHLVSHNSFQDLENMINEFVGDENIIWNGTVNYFLEKTLFPNKTISPKRTFYAGVPYELKKD